MNRFILHCATIMIFVLGGLCGFSLQGLSGQEPPLPAKLLPLPTETFLVAEFPAFLTLPEPNKRSTPQPWVMYAPTLPGYPDEHEQWMHRQFLDAGIAIAGVDAGEAYGSPEGCRAMSALYSFVTGERGCAPKVALLGRSRGGLWVSSWGAENVEKVAGIAGIYPVFDLRSYPGLEKAAGAYQLSASELETRLETLNPLAKVDRLAKARVPIFIIHGDVDTVVPLEKNSAIVQARYQALGAGDALEMIVPEGQGHNFWEGFFRCQPLVDFVIRQAREGNQRKTSEGP